MFIKKMFLLFLFLSFKSYGLNFFIENIVFQGLQNISKDVIIKKIPIKIGNNISDNQISNAIVNLFNTGYFEDVKVFRINQNKILFKVKEKPIISNITFSGNKLIKYEQIKSFLELHNLYAGSFFNKLSLLSFEKNIQELYQNIGQYNNQIKFSIEVIPYNRVNLKINFLENNFAKIKQINIIGNIKYSSKKLLSMFTLKSEVYLWNIFNNNNNYQKQKLIHDLDTLRSFYLNKGYARYNNNLVQINLTPNKKDVYISIYINEGEKYKISDINIIDKMPNFLSKKIKEIPNINIGEYYNFEKLNIIEKNIKNIFHENGFLYPNIKMETFTNDLKKTIKINFNINHDKRYYIRKIIFKGNFTSKDIVLRRQILQMEGSWVNKNLIEIGKNNLLNINFFDEVGYFFEKIPNFSDQLDLIYVVKEKNTGNFNFGFGYGADVGLTFQGTIQKENWLGTGNNIIFSTSKNSHKTNIELSFIKPYFEDYNFGFNSKVFYDSFKSDKSNFSKYKHKSYGLDGTINVPINSFNSIHYGLGFYYNDIFEVKSQISATRYLSTLTKENDKDFYSTKDVTLNYGWTNNSLNRNILPTKGKKVKIDGKITMPVSDNSFYKLTLDTQKYIPLNNDNSFIFYIRNRLGYGDGFRSNKELSFYENFYSNSFSSVRGFYNNTIGPKAIYYNNDSGNCYNAKEKNNELCLSNDAIGGNAIVTGSLEFIIPTPFVDDKNVNNFRTSIFFDFGTIWDTHWNNIEKTNQIEIPDYSDPKKIRFSTGISIQWISPFGPIELSYSFPLKKYKGDQIEKLQFTFGKNW